MARLVLVTVCLFAVAGCGADKRGAYAKANTALLARVPVYPGVTSPKTTASSGA
jgi:hypothetical protein